MYTGYFSVVRKHSKIVFFILLLLIHMGMCFGKAIKNSDYDCTNNFYLAMAPVAGNGETLCYSCHDIDENGICGENVDGSSPVIAKAAR